MPPVIIVTDILRIHQAWDCTTDDRISIVERRPIMLQLKRSIERGIGNDEDTLL